MTRLVATLLISLLLAVPSLVFGANDHLQETGLKKLSVAMILWRGETDSEVGFRDTLRHLDYFVDYSVFDAAQDKAGVSAIINRDILPNLEKFDYIYTFGTTVSVALKQQLNNRTPQVFNIVVDPVGAGLVDSMDSSNGNISGVSNRVPLAVQLENVRKVIPFQSIGFLYNPLENNSVLIRDKMRKLAGEMGFQLKELQASPQDNQLKKALQELVALEKKPDLVYLPADSFLISQAETIAELLNHNKINSVGAARAYIDKGILIGTVTDYTLLGYMAASVIDRNQRGEPLNTIPVQSQVKPRIVVNTSTAKYLGVNIPEKIMQQAIAIR